MGNRKISALMGAGVIGALMWLLYVIPPWQLSSVKFPSPDKKAEVENAYRVTLIQTLGGVFFVLTTFIAWRNLKATEEKQITERYSKSIEQPGNDKIEVRLGGIYALERITKDSPKDHWTIMEVLTSFVQEKSPFLSVEEGLQESPPKIAKDIQAVLTVIRRRDATKDPEHLRLDLQSANLRGACLGAYLRGDRYITANLRRIDFDNSCLSKADLKASNLSGVSLIKADLSDAILERASLENAKLHFARLPRTNLIEAILRKAIFERANLEGAMLINADAKEASFFHACLGRASFRESNLQFAKLQLANLEGANLKGANLRGACLMGAQGLTPEQVKSARNWQEAKYDRDFRKELGLPPESTPEEKNN